MISAAERSLFFLFGVSSLVFAALLARKSQLARWNTTNVFHVVSLLVCSAAYLWGAANPDGHWFYLVLIAIAISLKPSWTVRKPYDVPIAGPAAPASPSPHRPQSPHSSG